MQILFYKEIFIIFLTKKKFVGEPPNWFLNPFKDKSFTNFRKHWSKLKDFDVNIGDIKNIWELSRLGWLGTLSQAYAITLDEKYLNKMNYWVEDWCKKNPRILVRIGNVRKKLQ